PFAWVFPRLKAILPHDVKLVEWRATDSTMNDLAQELARRQTSEEPAPEVFVFIYGLQRYRSFRKQEDSFSFSSSSSDEPPKPQPDKQFIDLLREGPPHGMHLLTWIDTPAAIDRTLDRGGMREFDNRIL